MQGGEPLNQADQEEILLELEKHKQKVDESTDMMSDSTQDVE